MKNNDNKHEPIVSQQIWQPKPHKKTSKLRTHIETQLKMLHPSQTSDSKTKQLTNNNKLNQLKSIKNGMRCKTQTTLIPQSTTVSNLPAIATQRNTNSNKKYNAKMKVENYQKGEQHERQRGDIVHQSVQNNRKKLLSTREFMIQQDNKKLVQALRDISLDRKQFRHRMKTEVNEYMKLKQHMQKFKSSSTKQLQSIHIHDRISSLVNQKSEVSSTQFRKFLNQAIQNTKKKLSTYLQSNTQCTGNQIIEQFETS